MTIKRGFGTLVLVAASISVVVAVMVVFGGQTQSIEIVASVSTPESTSTAASSPTSSPTQVATPSSSPTPMLTPTPEPTAVSTLVPTPIPSPVPRLASNPVPKPPSTSTPSLTPVVTPTRTAVFSGLELGALPPTATRPLDCGGGMFSVLESSVPARLTEEAQEGFIRVRVFVPAGATNAGFVGIMGIAFFGNSSIKGSEILAVFPGAQRVDPNKDYRLPTVDIEIPSEAASLPAVGEVHELEWSFTLPVRAEHDTLRTNGWRWFELYDDMKLIPSPIVTLSFVLDETQYFVSHNCVRRPVIGK